MYSTEAFESICRQLSKGVPVYCKSFENSERKVGTSIDYKDDQVHIIIDDENFENLVCKIGDDRLCISAWIEAEAEERDGIQVATSADVERLIVLPKSAIPELMATSKADVVATEKTLKLEE
jgi:hypothetical protein